MTPVDVFREAAERSLMLSSNGNKLRVTPAERLTPDFAETLKAHKKRLLTMLQLPFVMAYSRTLGETIFLCEDEETRQALIEDGAEEHAIYTRDELQILVANNRAKPFIPDELCKLHTIKQTFRGRFTW